MDVATVLFVYHRYEHTASTLIGLKNSTILPKKLYIFQDGIGDKTNVEDWNRVNDLIKNVDFCEVEIHVADSNKGLSYSIKQGINYIMKKHDAAIVFEDDCRPHPLFMEYALDALEKYKDNKEVWSINGYSNNVKVEPNGYDAHFIGRTSSWGWATWKDRWAFFEEDYTLLKKIKSDTQKREQLKIWGEDLENYILGNIDGRNDSWAVFWSLQVLYRGGFCLAPYESLIKNEGLDGSGTHSGNIQYETKYTDIHKKQFCLPEKVEFPNNYTDSYIDFFHWVSPNERNKAYRKVLVQWMAKKNLSKSIGDYLKVHGYRNVSIWGTCDITELLINEIKDSVYLIEIIKTNNYNREEFFMDVPICDFTYNQINEQADLIIAVPYYDLNIIKKKLSLSECKIEVLGLDELIEAL